MELVRGAAANPPRKLAIASTTEDVDSLLWPDKPLRSTSPLWPRTDDDLVVARRHTTSTPAGSSPRAHLGAAMMPAAGVNARATRPEAVESASVARPARRRAQEQQLLVAQLALEDVALGQAEFLFHVPGREHLAVEDRLASAPGCTRRACRQRRRRRRRGVTAKMASGPSLMS